MLLLAAADTKLEAAANTSEGTTAEQTQQPAVMAVTSLPDQPPASSSVVLASLLPSQQHLASDSPSAAAGVVTPQVADASVSLSPHQAAVQSTDTQAAGAVPALLPPKMPEILSYKMPPGFPPFTIMARPVMPSKYSCLIGCIL